VKEGLDQGGLRAADELVDQLAEQLCAAHKELAKRRYELAEAPPRDR
jgi:hypothetical protein